MSIIGYEICQMDNWGEYFIARRYFVGEYYKDLQSAYSAAWIECSLKDKAYGATVQEIRS
jgi:hypothetical protein